MLTGTACEEIQHEVEAERDGCGSVLPATVTSHGDHRAIRAAIRS
jgi:hypothetical protein